MWEYRPAQLRLFVMAASYIVCVCVCYLAWLRLSSVPGAPSWVSGSGVIDAMLLVVIIATAILYAAACRVLGLKSLKRVVSLWFVAAMTLILVGFARLGFD